MFFFFWNQNSIHGGGSESEEGESFLCRINGAASLLRGIGDCPGKSENECPSVAVSEPFGVEGTREMLPWYSVSLGSPHRPLHL